MLARPTVIISRGREDGRAARLEDVLARLCSAHGWDVLIIPDLYHLPAGSPLRAQLAELRFPAALACSIHPRPAAQLLRDCGVRPAAVVDLRAYADAREAFVALDLPGLEGAGEVRELHAAINERWYPLIDRERCAGCHACLQFCLFGVYEPDAEGQVRVARPDNCKPGCPACARICPQGAIIFPLCDEPSLAGAPGTLMQPDMAARRMFYVRTGRPCPVCGEVATAGDAPAQGAPACPECGRALASAHESSPVHDEIDALIDMLNDLAGGEAR